METNLTWILAMLGAAVLSCWIAYQSTLVESIKKLLCLSDNPKPIRWRWFMKPLGWLWLEFNYLMYCPYCISVWIGTAINYFYFDIALIPAIIYSMIAVVFVGIYLKLGL